MKVADVNQPVPAGRMGPAQVLPLQSMIACSKPSIRRVTTLQLVEFLSVFWSTINTTSFNDYGQSPLKGPGPISGINDEPYSDRSLVCILQGHSYLPVTVNDALLLGITRVVDTTETSINGYRVEKRAVNVLNSESIAMYTHTCSVIAATLDALFERCTLLGYNVTHDHLRIMDDLESITMYLIGNSLPILMMPFWDNSLSGRFAVPGLDGSALNRTTRETKTTAWLKRPSGAWRNGWYEDLDGAKWHSDMISNEKDSTLDIPLSQFDMLTGEKFVCEDLIKCAAVFLDNWGPNSPPRDEWSHGRRSSSRMGSATVSSSTTHLVNSVKNIYGWETLLSNIVTIRTLIRWLVAMVTLHCGYFLGVTQWHNIGIGCLANFRAFDYLPLMPLPHLKMAFFALWMSGCVFNGPQRALAETWFIMYPAIVEVMLLHFSLLNLLAKLFCLRVSDVMFGPTAIFSCALHWLREPLAASDWLEFDGRVTSVVSVSEFNAVTLVEFLPPASRCAQMGTSKASSTPRCLCLISASEPTSRIEKALAIRFRNAGGLGHLDSYNRSTAEVLNSYEVVRFGYIVYGGDADETNYLFSFDDWDLVTLTVPLRRLTHLWNYRVRVFGLRVERDVATIADQPERRHVDDLDLQRIRCWKLSSRSIE